MDNRSQRDKFTLFFGKDNGIHVALMNKVGPMEPLESNGEVKVQKLGEPVLCLANSAIYSNKEVLEFLLVHRSIKLGKPAKKVKNE